MASVQVSLVIETEKQAQQIEQDARIKAEELLSAAGLKASANRETTRISEDERARALLSSARIEAEQIQKAELLSAAQAISELQKTAEQNNDRAVQAAVNVLIGRT